MVKTRMSDIRANRLLEDLRLVNELVTKYVKDGQLGGYMNSEKILGGEDLKKNMMSAITKHPQRQGHHSYITKTVEYADLYDDRAQESEIYLTGINKRWIIEGVVHMISVDSFDSFSMEAERGLLVMFQDYQEKIEVE